MRSISPKLTNHPTGASGFTLIEVLTAVGIIGIVSVSLYAGLAMSFNSVQNSRLELRATQILTEKLEVVRLYNWDQVNQSGFIPLNFTERYQPSNNVSVLYRGTIALGDASVSGAYSGTMKKVVAQITWTNGNAPCQKRMETLISQYGIQNYIY